MKLKDFESREFQGLKEGTYTAEIAGIREVKENIAIDYKINGANYSQLYSNEDILVQHLNNIGAQLDRVVKFKELVGLKIVIRASYRTNDEQTKFLNLVPTTSSKAEEKKEEEKKGLDF